ncbi:MAG: L-glutamate gamma-semialdehyde dehydrogenase [Myxococcota bacterium]|nr:L-glutamate gamma-semialdehyde dehydrogenase [Myxococcota bacterium]
MNSISIIPSPINEPILSYAPGTPERAAVKKALEQLKGEKRVLTSIINGEAVTTGNTENFTAPHNHQEVVATVDLVGKAEVELAVSAAMAAKPAWEAMSYDDRAAVFLKAADLLAGRYRPFINASTMIGQSKTAHQAEIDAACEFIDFLRFNVAFGQQILEEQPISGPGIWNRMDHRPLEGFILAITPFNFTAIAGNLCCAPALMGNTVVWKPARTQALSAQIIMDVLIEAGLPRGVINLVHASGPVVGEVTLGHADLGGIHFTGSTGVFQHLWSEVGKNIANYKSYPRVVGETGGKDFIVAHASADVKALAVGILRGSFEYQGQKCSAASRVYIPEGMWPALSAILKEELPQMKMGSVEDFGNFISAVIDETSFDKISTYIEYAKQSDDAEIWHGGGTDKSTGYFVEPTVVLTKNPSFKLMEEEIFGPVVTICIYPDGAYEETLKLCDQTSPYALTGAVFARDKDAVAMASEVLRNAAGNFYINDKPTGAVVGQQPFGGARASGTNDKAGSILNLLRWVSPRTIKETFDAPHDWRYSFLNADD